MHNKLKNKHNKKRNTAFLFEALVKELTKMVVSGDKEKQKTISVIIKEHFKKNTILDRELTLYKQLYTTNSFPKEIAEKLVNQVKVEHEKLNENDIFNEQSKLIAKVNKFVGAQVYNNFVPNYKTLATVSQIFNKNIEPKQKILLEQELLQEIVSEKPEKKMILERTDALVLNRFIDRFNESYNDKLLKEQKEILSKFITHTDDDLSFKIYLNEEINRLKQSINEALNNDLIKNNEEILTKTKSLNAVLNTFKVNNVNEDLIKKIMYIQEFVSEVSK